MSSYESYLAFVLGKTWYTAFMKQIVGFPFLEKIVWLLEFVVFEIGAIGTRNLLND
jgi:thiol:disulfide interchange protein